MSVEDVDEEFFGGSVSSEDEGVNNSGNTEEKADKDAPELDDQDEVMADLFGDDLADIPDEPEQEELADLFGGDLDDL